MSDYQQAIDLLAFVQRHPGHASQKPHGRRYGGDVAAMMQPGVTFRDKGFISTTINPDLAFESYDGEADWKIHINVPKGSKGIYVAEKSNYAWEKELLLPRNSEMRVTGKDSKTKTIYADYQ